jgi:predicted transposase/invertase (TIGR01784 family)
LIDFLNAMLPPENQVVNLTFRNPEQLPDNIIDRKAIFDIACTGEHNESFTVEMQKAKQLYFKDRALFYLSFPIQSQAQKGDWDFKLNPVFLVAILDFIYDEEEERRKLYRLVTLKDQDNDLFYEKLKLIFLQMPSFRLTESELKTRKDKWLFFLKNLESFNDIPSILREPIFEKAFDTAAYYKYSSAIQEAYQNDLKAYRDNYNVLDTARIEGEARGEAKGRTEGRTEGRAEGLAEGEAKGLAKGKAEGKAETARNLKRLGVPAETIAQATGLSLSEIEHLPEQ